MKKFLIILLSLVLSVSMFAFAACSDTPADDDPQTGNEQTGDDGQDGTQPDGDDENAGDDTDPDTRRQLDIGSHLARRYLLPRYRVIARTLTNNEFGAIPCFLTVGRAINDCR